MDSLKMVCNIGKDSHTMHYDLTEISHIKAGRLFDFGFEVEEIEANGYKTTDVVIRVYFKNGTASTFRAVNWTAEFD